MRKQGSSRQPEIPFKQQLNENKWLASSVGCWQEDVATMRLLLLNVLNKRKSSLDKNGWLRCTGSITSLDCSSFSLRLASLAFACDNTAPYTSYRNPCWAIHSIFTAGFDSNDFIKPLILAWSAWLQHRWVPLLISDSISREPCTAVAADTNMPSTLKSAGNLFPPQCSSSWCNSHSDKPPSLWYLETKWEEGWREEGITYFVTGIRREIVVTRQV